MSCSFVVIRRWRYEGGRRIPYPRGEDLVERAGQDRRRVADHIGGAEPHKPIRSDQHGTLRTDAAVLQPPAHDVDMVDVAESDSGRAQRYAALCSDFQRGLDPVPAIFSRYQDEVATVDQ